ncbi:hypothetical protein [Pseudomonas palmensis]|uniref:hypothetical protein n=1 Tax=Pseudomonas palmensis TaxID=2815362 RepID=UPI0039E83BD7
MTSVHDAVNKEKDLNVFSTMDNPRYAVDLTEKNYNAKTSRKWPYVHHVNDEIKSYALCPACKNPVQLINHNVSVTNAKILYARHAGKSVIGLADHYQVEYEDCPFHNPERFDSKTRRGNVARNEEIRQLLLHHFHYVISQLESATGVKYTNEVIESMLMHFTANRGYEYKAISVYNLPLGFAYMTEIPRSVRVLGLG